MCCACWVIYYSMIIQQTFTPNSLWIDYLNTHRYLAVLSTSSLLVVALLVAF